MSSQNTKVHLNDHAELQTEPENCLNAENCDRDNKNVIVQQDIAIKSGDGKVEHSDSENADLAIKDVTINRDSDSIVKEKMNFTIPDANIKSDDTKCDTCNSADVENITNSLAEKVNIENVPEVVQPSIQPECDIKNTKITEKRVLPVTPGELINRVKRLDISEFMHDTGSDNSAVVLKLQTDSLKNLLAYDSSSDDDDEAESDQNWQMRTINKSESESDSDSDSESSDEDDDDDDEDENDEIESGPKKKVSKLKLKRESPITEDFTLKIYAENNVHDLPPIRDVSNLDIDVEKEEFLHMGHIEAVIETLITVEAIPGTPAYDLDTCLFVEDKGVKKPMGAIYDVIGPVASPLYCIRFERAKIISDLNLKQGLKVFCAPKSKYTKYVFVRELMKHKGTDASWVGDVELPPEIAAQMSDDECESETSEPRKAYKRKHGSQERHRQFEEDMNRCNTLNSHATRLVDAHRHIPRASRYNDHTQRVLFNDIMAQTNRLPPSFDPTVPPPGFHPFPMRSQPITRPSMVWTRHQPVPMRPPRCQSFMGHTHRFVNSYTNNDMSHGPGTSSHPH